MSMDTQAAAKLVLAKYKRLVRANERRPTEKVIEQMDRFGLRVFQELGGHQQYHVSTDWTERGLGTPLAMGQLIDWLAKESGEDL